MLEWTGTDHTSAARGTWNRRASATLNTIGAMLLVDMVGDRNLNIRRESNSTRWLTDIIWAAAGRLGHGDVFLDEPLAVEDDHVPFLAAGVAAVDIIDLDYPAWHTADDTLDNVSARSLQTVGDVLLAALPQSSGTAQTVGSGLWSRAMGVDEASRFLMPDKSRACPPPLQGACRLEPGACSHMASAATAPHPLPRSPAVFPPPQGRPRPLAPREDAVDQFVGGCQSALLQPEDHVPLARERADVDFLLPPHERSRHAGIHGVDGGAHRPCAPPWRLPPRAHPWPSGRHRVRQPGISPESVHPSPPRRPDSTAGSCVRSAGRYPSSASFTSSRSMGALPVRSPRPIRCRGAGWRPPGRQRCCWRLRAPCRRAHASPRQHRRSRARASRRRANRTTAPRTVGCRVADRVRHADTRRRRRARPWYRAAATTLESGRSVSSVTKKTVRPSLTANESASAVLRSRKSSVHPSAY